MAFAQSCNKDPMENLWWSFLVKIVNAYKRSTISAKSFITDVWQGLMYESGNTQQNSRRQQFKMAHRSVMVSFCFFCLLRRSSVHYWFGNIVWQRNCPCLSTFPTTSTTYPHFICFFNRSSNFENDLTKYAANPEEAHTEIFF